MEVFSSLFTILIIVLAGMISRKAGIFQKEHAKTLSSFVYYFGLPTLFYGKISSLDLVQLDPSLVIGTLLPTVLILAALLGLKLLQVIPKDTFILLGLSISFGSYAFFGLAFFETFQEGIWFDHAIIAASLLGIVGILITIVLFEFATRQQQGLGFLMKILTNPLILSIMLGVISSIFRFRLPFLEQALTLIAQTASGTAIFVLGLFIYDRFSMETIKKALGFSIFRMVALPVAALGVVRFLLPDAGDLAQFLLLENGMPAAIALVVFAERYHYKIAETAGMVSLTSIFSFLSLTGIYYLSQLLH